MKRGSGRLVGGTGRETTAGGRASQHSERGYVGGLRQLLGAGLRRAAPARASQQRQRRARGSRPRRARPSGSSPAGSSSCGDHAAEQEAHAGHRLADASSRPTTRAWYCVDGQLLDRAQHRDPLDAVADAADGAGEARDQEVPAAAMPR